MSANPQQRKIVSLEKLNTLRDKVRQSFFISKKEVLQTPNNKNSPYYHDLMEDIKDKTKKRISEGTLLKFFYNDANRSYQVIIISTIEEYIDKILPRPIDKDDSGLMRQTEEEIKVFAKRIYIELITRKAGIPIDEEKDVIEEIYNSWYKLFCLIRDKMEILPVYCFKDIENPESIVGITSRMLNEILRLHLTEHQAKFRSWFEKAKQNKEYKSLTPQELQKKYPDYKILIKSLKETNAMLIASAKKLLELIDRE